MSSKKGVVAVLATWRHNHRRRPKSHELAVHRRRIKPVKRAQRIVSGICLVFAQASLWTAAAPAAPLAANACQEAQLEYAALSAAGVEEDFRRGAQWGQANLSAERLRQVARFIELQETILFRCPRPKPQQDEPAEAALNPDQAQTSKAKSTSAEPAETKPADGKPTGKPQKANTPARPNGSPTSPPDVAAKPQRMKPKVNDAYVPPPPPLGATEYQHPAPGPEPSAASGSAEPSWFSLSP